MDYFGGRKFVALLCILALGTGAEMFAPKGLSVNYVYLLLGLYTAFTAGNVGITLKALKAATPPTEPNAATDEPIVQQPDSNAQSIDITPVLAALDAVKADTTQLVQTIPNQIQALQFLTAAEQDRQQRRHQMMAEANRN